MFVPGPYTSLFINVPDAKMYLPIIYVQCDPAIPSNGHTVQLACAVMYMAPLGYNMSKMPASTSELPLELSNNFTNAFPKLSTSTGSCPFPLLAPVYMQPSLVALARGVCTYAFSSSSFTGSLSFVSMHPILIAPRKSLLANGRFDVKE